eukprot:scaffold122302_cov39-Tisochrysis_lutea.AAC.3
MLRQTAAAPETNRKAHSAGQWATMHNAAKGGHYNAIWPVWLLPSLLHRLKQYSILARPCIAL